jgi:hypothetical protein
MTPNTQSKHTPDPWKRGDCDSWIIWAPRYASTEWVSNGCTLGEPEAVVVAVVQSEAWVKDGLDPDEREAWLAETDATANLIAAAPELLAALRPFAEHPDGWTIYTVDAAIKAIAKAEGRS